jgi:hypothetical protein
MNCVFGSSQSFRNRGRRELFEVSKPQGFPISLWNLIESVFDGNDKFMGRG